MAKKSDDAPAARDEKREEKLASLKLERELLENEAAVTTARAKASEEQLRHEKRVAWAKIVTPPLMVVVTAITAYCGVNRHAHIAADEEFALKKFEIETTLRYGIIKDYLALPNDTSRSRLDMLSFIEETDEREAVKSWAKARREELQKVVTAQANQYQRMVDSFSAGNARPPQPGDAILICTVTSPPLGPGQDPLVTTRLVGRSLAYTDEDARASCRSLADAQCQSRGLDLSKCEIHFDKKPPGATAGP